MCTCTNTNHITYERLQKMMSPFHVGEFVLQWSLGKSRLGEVSGVEVGT